MPFHKVTRINKDGVVVREKRSHRRKYRKRPDTSFRDAQIKNPKSAGTLKSFYALGVYKGARIMKATQKIPRQYTREIELIYRSPVDKGANPPIPKSKSLN